MAKKRNERVLGALDDGQWFRLPGQSNVYRAKHFSKDGSRIVYGGSKDPKAHRQYAAMPARARVVMIEEPAADRQFREKGC